ncbi:MAG TPA: methylisocitrate lyase [Nitrososphaerales archaeon]|nr:methylisocitrate lyase [Nitrososphaerales archaeon]
MSDIAKSPAARLRDLISSSKTFAVPGIFSPSVALIARDAGFRCLYFSGAGFSNLLGLPDLGVTTLSEITDAVSKITSKVNLPVMVDADTGFGEALNVSRTVMELERIGAAAVQIEDQVMPKRCGHLSGKEVVSTEEMVKKIIAARQASKGIVIIARTDATAVEGLESAIKRSKLYIKAGADIIFPDALETNNDFLKFSSHVKAPLIANMTEFGKTPYLTVKQFSELRYKFVLFPVTAFRAAMKAVEQIFEEIARKGTQKGFLKKMMTRKEFYDLSDYYSFERFDKEIERKAKKLTNTN